VRRGVAIVAALVALGWLGMMERSVRLQATPTEDHLRAARTLNPDTLPDVRLAFLLQSQERTEDAAGVLEDVLRREPDNLEAWGLLYAITKDPRALEARRRLDPLRAR
jgi:hypothetical protein